MEQAGARTMQVGRAGHSAAWREMRSRDVMCCCFFLSSDGNITTRDKKGNKEGRQREGGKEGEPSFRIETKEE